MKKFLSSLLSLVLTMSMIGTAFAAETPSTTSMTYENMQGIAVDVQIPTDLIGELTDNEILSIIEDNNLTDGETVTILDVVYAEENTEDPSNIMPLWGETYTTTFSNVGAEKKAQDYFVISVAKGQSKTLSQKFSQTLTINVSGNTPYVSGNLGTSLTAEYSKSIKYDGPPETGSNNTREYRVQFYCQTKSWAQSQYSSSGILLETRRGTVTVPTKYASYSIDTKI